MNELQQGINRDREEKFKRYLTAQMTGQPLPELSADELIELGMRTAQNDEHGVSVTTGGFTIPKEYRP
jgi:hypothetical protein